MILIYQYSYRKKDSLGRWRLQKHFVSIKKEEKPGTITPQGYKLETLEGIWLAENWWDESAKLVYNDIWKRCTKSADKYIHPIQAEKLLNAITYCSEAGCIELTAKLLDYAHTLGLDVKTESKYKL